MKILTTYEAKNAFPKVLKLSQKDIVIVTNRGKPVAAIQGLKNEDDLEDYLLERSPKFWAMIRRAAKGKASHSRRSARSSDWTRIDLIQDESGKRKEGRGSFLDVIS